MSPSFNETTPVSEYDKKLLTALAGGAGPDMYTVGDFNFTLYKKSRNWLSPADPKTFG